MPKTELSQSPSNEISLSENLIYSPDTGELRNTENKKKRLSSSAKKVFDFLVNNPSQSFSYAEIYVAAYEPTLDPDTLRVWLIDNYWKVATTIQAQITIIRNGLKSVCPGLERRIKNIPHYGYRWISS